MHIPPYVAEVYGELQPIASSLKAQVDRFMGRRPQNWHYISRVKSEESFLQKLETGRVHDLRLMEDFFACSLIVPAGSMVNDALDFVQRFFSIERRRPEVGKTSKSPSDFRFDDLRLYGRLQAPEDLPSGPIHGMLFEIQIKTLLTHAWGVATHDTVYKSVKTSWARDRIAYQLRAILEHVELAVNGVDALEGSGAGLPEGETDERLNRYVDFIQESWPRDFAPPDLRRAAVSVDDLADKFRVDPDTLIEAFISAFDPEVVPIGISPVGHAFEVIEKTWPDKAQNAWKSKRLNGYSWLKSVVSAQEVEIPGRPFSPDSHLNRPPKAPR